MEGINVRLVKIWMCWIAEAEEFKYSDRLQLEEIFLFGAQVYVMKEQTSLMNSKFIKAA